MLVRWEGHLFEVDVPAFVDESIARVASGGPCGQPDRLEIDKSEDLKRRLVLTATGPFQPRLRYEVHLVLTHERGESFLDVVDVVRI